MAGRIKMSLAGASPLIRRLRKAAKPATLRKIIRKGSNAAGTVTQKAVRDLWDVRTGLSKKSVTKKLIRTKFGYIAIIGIDKSAEFEVDGKKHVPSNIDHLEEFGFQHVSGKTVPAKAPLRRGAERSKAEAARVFETKVAAEADRELAKIAKG